MAKTILTERYSTEDIKSTLNALSRCGTDWIISAYGQCVRGVFAHPSILYLLFYAGHLQKVNEGEYQVGSEVIRRADKLFGVFCESQRQTVSGKQFLVTWQSKHTQPVYEK